MFFQKMLGQCNNFILMRGKDFLLLWTSFETEEDLPVSLRVLIAYSFKFSSIPCRNTSIGSCPNILPIDLPVDRFC